MKCQHWVTRNGIKYRPEIHFDENGRRYIMVHEERFFERLYEGEEFWNGEDWQVLFLGYRKGDKV